MPLSVETPPDADQSAALLLWLIRNGTASLVTVIRKQMHLVRRALLPSLIRQYHGLLAVFFSPLWQRIVRRLAKLLDNEAAMYCLRVLKVWLSQMSRALRAHKGLGGPNSAEPQNSTEKPSSTITVARDAEQPYYDKQQISLPHSKANLAVSSSASLPVSVLSVEEACNVDASLAHLSPSLPQITPTGTNISPCKADGTQICSSTEENTDSILLTPRRREPLPGNWSSVCFLVLDGPLVQSTFARCCVYALTP